MLTRVGMMVIACAAGSACGQLCEPAWDAAFGQPGFGGTVNVVGEFDIGSGPRLYAGGNFLTAGGVSARHIARWNGSFWSALGPGFDGGSVSSMAVFDEGTGPRLYVGGTFSSAGGVTARRIARWNGSAWSAHSSWNLDGLQANVRALAVFDDGSGPKLHAAGRFDYGITVGEARILNHIGKWTGTAWEPVGGGVDFVSLPVLPSIACLQVFDDGTGPALFVGGEFDTLDPDGGSPIACNGIAKWDGSAWSTVGNPLNLADSVDAMVVFDDGGGPALYIGSSRIWRYRNGAWQVVTPLMNSGVTALAVFDDGSGPRLHAAGSFTIAGTTNATRIARWNGSSWSALGSGIAHNASSFCDINDLASYTGSGGPILVAGGYFDTAGGHSAMRIAAWRGCEPCYANCDGSTAAPALNVADFTCFLQRFAAGESYANCDGSTAIPVLNVADFTCFLQRFAAGCP